MKNSGPFYWFRYWFWALSRLFVVIYVRRKFNIHLTKSDPMPKPPFLMIGNHGTFFDPWIVGHYSKYPVAIMTNETGINISAPFVQWYLRNIGTFKKKKGAADLTAMRTTLNALKNGFPVLIFPEGQSSWDGQSQPVFTGIEKIIKRSKASLVITKSQGAFLTRPWWARSWRKGTTSLERTVYSYEQISAMSDTELRDLIIESVKHNDVSAHKDRSIPFTGENCAEGLDRFIWACPSCKSEDTLECAGNTIHCTNCNDSWNIDPLCQITGVNSPGALDDWSQWHKKFVQEQVLTKQDDPFITKSENCSLIDIHTNGTRTTLSSGTLIYTKDKLTFKAVNKEYSFSIFHSEINNYTFQVKDIFDFTYDKKPYYIHFPRGSAMKWVYYYRYNNNYETYEQQGYF